MKGGASYRYDSYSESSLALYISIATEENQGQVRFLKQL
jgi:hypothetical protein